MRVQKLKDVRVLFVEDDELTRVVLGKHLEKKYSTIFEASDGAEGLKIYKREMPDIVVTDITMPIMNGNEMLNHIFKIKPDQPVVVLTGYSEDSEFTGDVKILHKPVVAADVMLLIDSFIEG